MLRTGGYLGEGGLTYIVQRTMRYLVSLQDFYHRNIRILLLPQYEQYASRYHQLRLISLIQSIASQVLTIAEHNNL
jgi:hypothetical protein